MTQLNDLTDAELVTHFKNGNTEALNVLVKRKHVEFCEKAYGLVRDKDVAKDIAQDTWRTIIKNIKTLNQPRSFTSWSSRILYLKSIDVLRLQTKERKQKDNFKQEIRYSEPEVTESREQLKSNLLLAIKTLPTHQQQVIQLFYVESYSLKEIAGILKINTGTVKSRLFHAREKLKQLVKQ